MPSIKIETCSGTPSYCALEAIMKAMKNNYTQRRGRDYQHESIIKVESGLTLKVVEVPLDMGSDSPCSCEFTVTKQAL